MVRIIMRALVAALIAGAVSLSAIAGKKPKGAIEVAEFTAKHRESLIDIDTRVRNTGEKPIRKLVLSFNFFAPGHAAVTTLKAEIDEETLGPGEDASVSAQTKEPARAVEISVDASDEAGNPVLVAKAGPYPIN